MEKELLTSSKPYFTYVRPSSRTWDSSSSTWGLHWSKVRKFKSWIIWRHEAIRTWYILCYVHKSHKTRWRFYLTVFLFEYHADQDKLCKQQPCVDRSCTWEFKFMYVRLCSSTWDMSSSTYDAPAWKHMLLDGSEVNVTYVRNCSRTWIGEFAMINVSEV